MASNLLRVVGRELYATCTRPTTLWNLTKAYGIIVAGGTVGGGCYGYVNSDAYPSAPENTKIIISKPAVGAMYGSAMGLAHTTLIPFLGILGEIVNAPMYMFPDDEWVCDYAEESPWIRLFGDKQETEEAFLQAIQTYI